MLKNQGRSASIVSFPYRYKKIDSGIVAEPLVQVKVRAKYGWQPLWFLMDSGADTSSMTIKLARLLGLSFEYKKTELQGVGSEPTYGYFGEMDLMLGKETIKVSTYFLESKNDILLLGRMDLFNHFNILFDNQKKETVFEKI